MGDPLFDVKNQFYLGNYQQCVKEASKTSNDAQVTLERKCFLYRAYIAQGKPRIALDEINDGSDGRLKAIRIYADYMANARNRQSILSSLDSYSNPDDMFYLMAATIHSNESNFDGALRMLHQSDSIECRAVAVQCLLKINRVDLALKEVKRMQEEDEDATITQLATAWTNMAVGKDKLQDAFYIYQEMMDKYGQTALLLVAQAATLLLQQKYDQADELLQEALQRDANYAEALINMVVVSQCLGKPVEQTTRYINQMKDTHPGHPWTIDLVSKEQKFERLITESAA